MRSTLLALVLLSITVGCKRDTKAKQNGQSTDTASSIRQPEAARPRIDSDRLIGTWVAIESEVDGLKSAGTHSEWTFEPGKATIIDTIQGERPLVSETDWATDETVKPKSLFLERIGTAIYELDGDKLRVCLPAPGDTRPTEFSSRGQRILHTFKRK